ncbi:hypothetical protein C8R45DRAFT_1098379 [Mycena sanguinolenta]|nr:hypothetical protein C8R45DRAFT_1098379 [Mycena sanguinolenta]
MDSYSASNSPRQGWGDQNPPGTGATWGHSRQANNWSGRPEPAWYSSRPSPPAQTLPPSQAQYRAAPFSDQSQPQYRLRPPEPLFVAVNPFEARRWRRAARPAQPQTTGSTTARPPVQFGQPAHYPDPSSANPTHGTASPSQPAAFRGENPAYNLALHTPPASPLIPVYSPASPHPPYTSRWSPQGDDWGQHENAASTLLLTSRKRMRRPVSEGSGNAAGVEVNVPPLDDSGPAVPHTTPLASNDAPPDLPSGVLFSIPQDEAVSPLAPLASPTPNLAVRTPTPQNSPHISPEVVRPHPTCRP